MLFEIQGIRLFIYRRDKIQLNRAGMDLVTLEKAIGYSFKNPEFLARALTHRSWAHESLKGKPDFEVRAAANESLEFLGDSVLGLAIAEMLFREHPETPEGGLTLMKHRLVSAAMLADIAKRIGLGRQIRIGKGEEHSGGREKPQLLANALEAIIGAVFLDGGYIAARSLVSRLFADKLKEVTPESSLDYKSMLQETLQAQKLAAPVYKLLRSEGQPHERVFYVEARWEGGSAPGYGKTIKSAEMMAASRAIEALAAGNIKKQKQSD